MNLAKTLILSGLLLPGLLHAAEAADDSKPCIQYTLGAWLVDGQSPYKAFQQCASASVVSDPHITTFKGLSYDHSFPGDYTLMELQDGSGFSIVGRFVFDAGNKVSSYTIPKAVLLQWPGHSAEIHRGSEGLAILIDGNPTKIADNRTVQIADVGYIRRKGPSYFIADTGADVAAVVNTNQFYLDLNVTVPKAIDTVGLLGSPLSLSLFERSGVELPVTVDAGDPELSKTARADFVGFIESWRITGANVFSGEDLPVIPDYSAKIYTLADLSGNRKERAGLKCDVLEVVFKGRFNRNNCLFDMGFGGNKFAISANRNQPSVMRMEVLN